MSKHGRIENVKRALGDVLTDELHAPNGGAVLVAEDRKSTVVFRFAPDGRLLNIDPPVRKKHA